MKSFLSPAGFIVGFLILIPYIFFDKQWDLLATIVCVISAAIAAIMGGEHFFKNRKSR